MPSIRDFINIVESTDPESTDRPAKKSTKFAPSKFAPSPKSKAQQEISDNLDDLLRNQPSPNVQKRVHTYLNRHWR